MTKDELKTYIESKGGISALSTAELRDAIATVEDIDPYTILGLIEEIFTLIKQEGTDVYVNGQAQERIDFLTDPQAQITSLVQLTNELGIEDTRLDALIDALDSTKADASTVTTISNQVDKNTSDIANIVGKSGTTVNVNGVAQTSLNFDSDPQSQLDNKADYSDIEGINSQINSLQNDKQNKLTDNQIQAIGEIDAIKGIALDNQTNKASKVEVNSLSMCPTNNLISNPLNLTSEIKIFSYTALYNGYLAVDLKSSSSGQVWIQNQTAQMGYAKVLQANENIYAFIPCRKGDNISLETTTSINLRAINRFIIAKEV